MFAGNRIGDRSLEPTYTKKAYGPQSTFLIDIGDVMSDGKFGFGANELITTGRGLVSGNLCSGGETTNSPSNYD